MRDRGGNFRSVRDTLIHIFGGVNGFGLPYWNLPSLSFAELVLVSVKITSLVLRLDGSETAPNRPFPVLKSA